MFDGTHIGLDAEICERLRSDKGIALTGSYDLLTGKKFETADGRLHSLYIKMESLHKGEIRGSLAKFWNAHQGLGATNWRRFTFRECVNAIDILSGILGREPNQLIAYKLEAGYNLENPAFPVREIIKRGLMMGGEHFERWKRNVGIQIDRTQSYFKLYDKGHVSEIPLQMLRWEVGGKKRQFWEGQGIYSLADLQDIRVWHRVHERLIKYLHSVLFTPFPIGKIPLQKFSPSQQNFLSESQFLGFWDEKGNSKARLRAKERLFEILNGCEFDQIGPLLIAQAHAVFEMLIDSANTRNEGGFYRGFERQSTQNEGGFYPEHRNHQKKNEGGFYPLDNRVKITTPPPSPLPELHPDQDQVEADSEARPLPTCKVCLNPIEGRGKGAKTCGPACKITADARARATRRHRAKCGNVDGVLFEDSA